MESWVEILALSMIGPFLFAYSIPPVTFQISLPPTTYAYHLQTTTYNLGTLAASNLPPTTYTYHIQLINPCVMPGPQIPYSRGIDVYRHVSNSAVGTKKFVSLQGFFYPCLRRTIKCRVRCPFQVSDYQDIVNLMLWGVIYETCKLLSASCVA